MVKTLFRRPLLPALALPLLFAPAPLPAQEGTAPYVVVESGRSFVRLQDAVDAIGDGQGTIRIPPGYHRHCAVQSAGSVALVAAAAGRANFDGVTCPSQSAPVPPENGEPVERSVVHTKRVRAAPAATGWGRPASRPASTSSARSRRRGAAPLSRPRPAARSSTASPARARRRWCCAAMAPALTGWCSRTCGFPTATARASAWNAATFRSSTACSGPARKA